MYVGVADATRMHFHKDLIRSGLGLRNVFDLPRSAHSGHNCSLHDALDARAFATDARFLDGKSLPPRWSGNW
jgi:hypothetical protein